MTDQLQQLLREEAGRIDVPPAPTDAILAGGRRRRTVRRTRALVAAAACVVLAACGVLVADRLSADDVRGPALDPAVDPSTRAVAGRLAVSSSAVGRLPFGSGAAEVRAAVSARLGEPDVAVGPQRFFRVSGSEGWFEGRDDPMSPSWRFPVLSVDCWGELCLMFGGEHADALRLRGWELAEHRRWTGDERTTDVGSPDVRLAGTGVRLGDTWQQLHAAYPGTTVGGGEGASVTVAGTPWRGISDGVGTWRLSGVWDYAHPTKAPAGAVVTRLSAGEGPEPGCC